MEVWIKKYSLSEPGFRNSATYFFDGMVNKRKGCLFYVNVTLFHVIFAVARKEARAHRQMLVSVLTKRQLAFFVLNGLKRTDRSSELWIILLIARSHYVNPVFRRQVSTGAVPLSFIIIIEVIRNKTENFWPIKTFQFQSFNIHANEKSFKSRLTLEINCKRKQFDATQASQTWV